MKQKGVARFFNRRWRYTGGSSLLSYHPAMAFAEQNTCHEEKQSMDKNIVWQSRRVHKAHRSTSLNQNPCCVWFTGLSGAGKTTLAMALEEKLHVAGRHVYLLDGDNIRHGINSDLGFSAQDRIENIRRVAEVAHLMVDAGLIVLVALISPFREDRLKARSLFGPGEFIEIFVDASLDVCEHRDIKGLYAKARRGELRDFTGIDSPYEAPLEPEVRVDTGSTAMESCLDTILQAVQATCGKDCEA